MARGSECADARPVRPLFTGIARSSKTCPILTCSTILKMAHHNLTVLSTLAASDALRDVQRPLNRVYFIITQKNGGFLENHFHTSLIIIFAT